MVPYRNCNLGTCYLQQQLCDITTSCTDMCMMQHDAWAVEPFRNCNLGTRYLSTCGRGRGRANERYPLRWTRICLRRSVWKNGTHTDTCNMYTSSLRHIHDPVLLSQDRNYTCFFISRTHTRPKTISNKIT